MTVHIFGKKDCGKCEQAKKTISTRLGVSYTYTDITSILSGEIPDNWRETGLAEALAAYTHLEDLPLVRIDDSEIMTYPQAMKLAKSLLKQEQEVLVA